MTKVKTGEAIKTGWQKWKQRGWYFMGLSAAMLGLTILVAGDAFMSALVAVLYVGLLAVMLEHYRGNTVQFDDLFIFDRRLIDYAFVTVIKTVIILLGFVALIVPGVYFALRFMFAEMFVVDKGMRPLEAMRASTDFTTGHKWRLLWFSFVAMLVFLLGLAFFGVGIFIAMPVVMLAMIHIYETLDDEAITEDSSVEPAADIETVTV